MTLTGTTNYPAGLDDFTTVKDEEDPHGQDLVDVRAAVEAVEAELGITPSGASATLAARLDAIDTALAAKASATSVSDHLADGSDAHDAAAISYAGGTGMAATDVEAAVDELATEKQNASVISANGKGYINHGATAGTSRPSGFQSIEWRGSVEPDNLGAEDTWVGAPDDALNALLAIYKPLGHHNRANSVVPQAAGVIHMLQTQATTASGGANSGLGAFYLDPDDLLISGKQTKLRVHGEIITNAIDPGSGTFTVELRPVATWGGASGAHPTIASTGAAVGSVLVASDPAAATPYRNEGADFNHPAAGWYTLVLVTSATITANAHMQVGGGLDYRHV